MAQNLLAEMSTLLTSVIVGTRWCLSFANHGEFPKQVKKATSKILYSTAQEMQLEIFTCIFSK